tara:strand:+ start:410 stop:1168 length:759 start_codon:yes stop_codon:yes gene_type:complete
MYRIIDRIEEIATDYKQSIPKLLKQEEEHGKGFNNYFLVSEHRLIAVADYLRTGDVALFRSTLKKALSYRLALYEAPENVPEKRFFTKELSELTYVMDSLAAGDLAFTRRMMAPFQDLTYKKMTPLMGYLHFFLSGFLFEMPPHFASVLEEALAYWEKRLKSYAGYALGFKAIYKKDSGVFVEALKTIMKGHKRLCHPSGEYGNTEDEVIGIWPLGMANLARLKGLDFKFDHPQLPSDLIIPVPLMQRDRNF